MSELTICGVCGTKRDKQDCLLDDEVYFCDQKCLDKSKYMDYIWCPTCDKDFFEEGMWFGHCIYCNREWWKEEDCTEDYSDCWDAVYWKDDK